MIDDSPETVHLLQRTRLGDPGAFGHLLSGHRPRLARMIAVRLDLRLRGRIDADDVIQDAFLEATERLHEYLSHPTMPFFLWLRFLTGQKLLALHRHHLGVQGRDARREVALPRGRRDHRPEATSLTVADVLLASQTSPSRAAAREELRGRVEQALSAMDPIDREVLVLRHFEQLSNEEAACEIGIEPSATSKRFVRALRRLKEVLAGMPGGLEGLPG